MPEKPLVSVIVPAYNCGKFIGQCLESLVNQSYENIEIIIIYDPSRDNTLKVIKRYKEKYPKLIRVFKQRKKTSPAIARNVGIALARGQLIAFCDCDDYFNEKKIEKQVNEMLNNKEIGLTYTDVIIIDESGKIIRYEKAREWNFNNWIKKRFIAFSSVMVRRELITKIKGFNQSYDTFDDFDFLIRLARKTKFKRISKFLTYYRVHSANLSRNKFKSTRNRVKILLHNGYIKLALYELYKYFVKWNIIYRLLKMAKEIKLKMRSLLA